MVSCDGDLHARWVTERSVDVPQNPRQGPKFCYSALRRNGDRNVIGCLLAT